MFKLIMGRCRKCISDRVLVLVGWARGHQSEIIVDNNFQKRLNGLLFVCRMDTFTSNKGTLFCTTHFKQLFKIKGNYDEVRATEGYLRINWLVDEVQETDCFSVRRVSATRRSTRCGRRSRPPLNPTSPPGSTAPCIDKEHGKEASHTHEVVYPCWRSDTPYILKLS